VHHQLPVDDDGADRGSGLAVDPEDWGCGRAEQRLVQVDENQVGGGAGCKVP